MFYFHQHNAFLQLLLLNRSPACCQIPSKWTCILIRFTANATLPFESSLSWFFYILLASEGFDKSARPLFRTLLLWSTFTTISLSSEDIVQVFWEIAWDWSSKLIKSKVVQVENDDEFDLLQGHFAVSICIRSNWLILMMRNAHTSIVIQVNQLLKKEFVNSLGSNLVWIIWIFFFFILFVFYLYDYVKQSNISLIIKIIQLKHYFNVSSCADSVRVDILVNCLQSSSMPLTKL